MTQLTTNLIEKHIPFAQKLAYLKRIKSPRQINVDELTSAAYMGLCEAAHRFDPGKGVAFTTYAFRRIIGAMNDYVRETVTTSSHSHVIYQCSAPSIRHHEAFDDTIHALAPRLEERAKMMLKWYYHDEMTMKEISIRCGVTEGRVSQLLKQYTNQIRSTWRKDVLIAELAA